MTSERSKQLACCGPCILLHGFLAVDHPIVQEAASHSHPPVVGGTLGGCQHPPDYLTQQLTPSSLEGGVSPSVGVPSVSMNSKPLHHPERHVTVFVGGAA